ncbi:tripartite motif-containing protein 45-like [Dendronephthya gigantea]|uniref:tripartite motif-containing protein 45-like n=1 Tax=Dendronephthya gigantea TaxID=151771 RepID=UPI00106BB720|nr:tripartite motif-containing protein 45-like [Dendronephthya gigantea]
MSKDLAAKTAKSSHHSEPGCGARRLSAAGDCDENNNPITGDLICERRYVECIDDKHYLKCPLCSTLKKIKLRYGDNGACLEGLSSDFVALNALETCGLNVNDLHEEGLYCSRCPTRAQSRCSECALFLCVNCQRAHKGSNDTRDHNVCSLALLRVNSNEPVHTGDYCRNHVGEKLTHFCMTCDHAICNDCTFLDHSIDTHSVTELSEITPTQRRQLAELLSGVRQRVPFLKRTLLEIDSVLQSLPDHADAVAREIARNTENFIQTLRQRQEELLDELTKLCSHKAKALHDQKSKIQSELVILEGNCKASERILRSGSNSEIATVNNLVYQRLQFLRNMKLDIEPDENAEFGYDPGSEKLSSEILECGRVFLVNASSPMRVIGDGLQDAAVGKFPSFTLAKSGCYFGY